MKIFEVNFVPLEGIYIDREYEEIDTTYLKSLNDLNQAYIYIKDNYKINRNMKIEQVKNAQDICQRLDFGLANRFIENHKNFLIRIGDEMKYEQFVLWIRQFILNYIPKAFVLINSNFDRYNATKKLIPTLYQMHSCVKEMKVYNLIGKELNEISIRQIKSIKSLLIDPNSKDCFEKWEENQLKVINMKPVVKNAEIEKITRVFASTYIYNIMNKYNTTEDKTVSLISFTNSRELTKNLFLSNLYKGSSLSSKKNPDSPLNLLITSLSSNVLPDYTKLHDKYKAKNVLSRFEDAARIKLKDLRIVYKS